MRRFLTRASLILSAVCISSLWLSCDCLCSKNKLRSPSHTAHAG
jgi:hypothetical protein